MATSVSLTLSSLLPIGICGSRVCVPLTAQAGTAITNYNAPTSTLRSLITQQAAAGSSIVGAAVGGTTLFLCIFINTMLFFQA